MCNLSEGIKEKGIAEGKIEGINEMIVKFYRAGYPVSDIAKVAGQDENTIRKIIEQTEISLV